MKQALRLSNLGVILALMSFISMGQQQNAMAEVDKAKSYMHEALIDSLNQSMPFVELSENIADHERLDNLREATTQVVNEIATNEIAAGSPTLEVEEGALDDQEEMADMTGSAETSGSGNSLAASTRPKGWSD